MKTKFSLVLFLLVAIQLHSQDAKEILKKAFEKCQSVQNGYYEMTDYFKPLTREEPYIRQFRCTFKKLDHDPLFSSAFNNQQFYNNMWDWANVYTGNELIWISHKDSTATILEKVKWFDEIKSIRHNYKFYSPLTNTESVPLPKGSDFTDTSHTFEFLGEEKINGLSCYHIRVNEKPENDVSQPAKDLKIENEFWINREDFIPIQYSLAIDMVMNGDTMHQYGRTTLTKYELNRLNDETPLTLQAIPPSFKMKDYVPETSPELLPNDTIAPDWSLESVKNEKVALKSLRGKVVLIDFFYKSCYPCMKALPVLQSLHEKFRNKGFVMIGIDPMDKPKDHLDLFLSKRGVTYTVLYSDQELPRLYHVSGYPTLYLIDKDGKIIFAQPGYGDGTEERLEKIIEELL